MSNATLDALKTAVANEITVNQSAVTLINGIAARQQAAIDAAIAGGASADDLKPVQDEVDALNASSTALATAITANTPATPAPAPAPAA